MRICVLGSPDSWYCRDLIRAGGERHEIVSVPFSILHTGWFDQGEPQTWSGDYRLTDFDAVLVRTMPPGSLEQVVFRMDVLGRLEAEGMPVVNPPRTLEVAIDKYLSTARLRAAGLNVPATWVGQGVDEALEAFQRLGGDVVLKPLFGSEGRGLMRITDESLAWRAVKSLTQLGAVLYMQRFIPHPGYDVRVLVIGERLLTMKRINHDDWRTNLSRGGRGEPFTCPPEIERLAVRAAEVLGAPLAGVDLLPGLDGNWYLLELNAVPGWRGLSRALDCDVARLVLDYLEVRIRAV